MGVSFTWKPENPNKGISFAGGSGLHGIMEEAFGGFPITLKKENISVLEGIKVCNNPDIQELIDAIYEHDAVVVEAHW